MEVVEDICNCSSKMDACFAVAATFPDIAVLPSSVLHPFVNVPKITNSQTGHINPRKGCWFFLAELEISI